jgi:hypothetical protein
LLQPHEQDAGDGLRKLAAALAGFDARVRLHVQFVDNGALVEWNVEGGSGKPAVQKRAPKQAGLPVVATRDLALDRPGAAQLL